MPPSCCRKRYETTLKRIDQVSPDDVFESSMNSYARVAVYLVASAAPDANHLGQLQSVANAALAKA